PGRGREVGSAGIAWAFDRHRASVPRRSPGLPGRRSRPGKMCGVTDVLCTEPALDRPDLLAPAVLAVLRGWQGSVPPAAIEVVEIHPEVADTTEFCARYGVPAE